MTLTPADLERIEARRVEWHGGTFGEPCDTALSRYRFELVKHGGELIALARRALELESALDHLGTVQDYESSQHVRLVAYYRRPGEYDVSPRPNTVLGLAKMLGWPGLQSEGGKEQDG